MKILIADDESLIRQSICLFLEDLGIGREDIVEASNGEEMLKAVEANHFDLALTDIRMPSMDGLEAIRLAKKAAPWTDYYILTGFDDFQYAREGIRLGVCDYILKPLKRDDLEKILEQTISSLEQKLVKLKNTLKLCTAALFSSQGEDILLPLPCRPILITNDVPDVPFSSSELLSRDDGKLIVIPYKQPAGVFLFLFELPEHPGYTDCYRKQLAESYQKDHTIVEGRIIHSRWEWLPEYERMISLANGRFLFGAHRLYRCSTRSPEMTDAQAAACRACGQGMTAWLKGDYARFTLSCQSILDFLEHREPDSSLLSRNMRSFLASAYHLDGRSTRSIKSGLALMAASMTQKAAQDFRGKEILSYISEHFRDDLSLSGVAEVFGLSPNYFSTLFKKQTGRNFVQYLTDLRIQEGKRLLLDTRMTVKEISEAAGYCSTSFFIRLFKKSEGITPLEYRNQHE